MTWPAHPMVNILCQFNNNIQAIRRTKEFHDHGIHSIKK